MSTNEKSVTPVDNKIRAFVYMGMGLLSIIIGFVLTPSMADMMEGLRLQETGSGLLDFNTFLAAGQLGAPFVNAGLMLIIVMISYLLTNTTINGGTIAAAYMVFGFSFCGKTLWNVWPLFFGVILHAVINKKKINTVTGLAWFSAALSPFVSVATLYIRMGGQSNETIGEVAQFSAVGLVLAIIIGLMAGYMVAVFASFLPEKHTGLSLYNAGFAAGLTGFVLFSLMKVLGYGHTSSGPMHDFPDLGNWKLIGGIAALLAYLVIVGVLISAKEKAQAAAVVTKLYSGSAVEQYGLGATLVNMGVCGFGCVLYWVLTTTATAHGPLFACLFTVVGFASNGISLRTMAPIMAGVYGMSFIATAIKAALIGAPVLETAFAYVGSKNMVLAAIFGCGMAPVVYRHGTLVGILTGAIHSILVVNTGGLHGWMNLYNNGFCAGLVVTFMVPAILILLGKYQQEGK